MSMRRGGGPALYFALQTRLHRDSEGNLRSLHGYAQYAAWKQYLGVVSEMVLLARVSPEVRDDGVLVEGVGVRVLAAPHYRGVCEFIRVLPRTWKFVQQNVDDPSALYGARVPDVFGSMLHRRAQKIDAKFFAQVVGDRAEVMRSGSLGVLGRLLWRFAQRATAAQVRAADGVIYVTETTLQKRYPAGRNVPTAIRSNVILGEESFAASPRSYGDLMLDNFVLVTAGSQERDYKGHDVLIEAVALLKQRSVNCRAVVVGDGLLHDSLRQLAVTRGVEREVTFLGQLPTAADVRKQLLGADIFVLPSRSEGLSRVLIEAMAAGIFCIGTEVGGTPELLPLEQLVPVDDPQALADAIQHFAAQPAAMTRAAAAHQERARIIARERSGQAVLQDFLTRLVED